jgi:anti-sigma factor RsiW
MIDTEALSCQELVELVTGYLENALDVSTRTAFDRHLAGCADCTRYLGQLDAVIRATGRLVPADLSPDAESALVEAFRGWARST